MAIINANVIAMTIYPEDFPEAIAYMGAAFRKKSRRKLCAKFGCYMFDK